MKVKEWKLRVDGKQNGDKRWRVNQRRSSIQDLRLGVADFPSGKMATQSAIFLFSCLPLK